MTASTFVYLVAIAVAIHGLIHLLGVGVYLELLELADLPYKTTLLGGAVDVGDLGIRIFGVLNGVAAVGFVASAAAMVMDWEHWWPLLFAVTLLSLVLTTLDWTVAFAGILANLAILGFLLAWPRLKR